MFTMFTALLYKIKIMIFDVRLAFITIFTEANIDKNVIFPKFQIFLILAALFSTFDKK
jgi:hypothetical protein